MYSRLNGNARRNLRRSNIARVVSTRLPYTIPNVIGRSQQNRRANNTLYTPEQQRANLMNPQFVNANIGLVRSNLRPSFLPNNPRQYLSYPTFNSNMSRRIVPTNQGGYVGPSNTYSMETPIPAASGFTLTNSGERNITFSKEFVAGFLKSSVADFTTFALTTHPSLNLTVIAVANVYQRYKILSYQFKYKATCSTSTVGLHYSGVDYGTQQNLPLNFTEAQTLEHFSVGPIWRDSSDWHTLKQSHIRERWFDVRMNSADPESRPARIIFGSLGASTLTKSPGALGLLEVKVNYLFSGLSQNFTGEPPSKLVSHIISNDSEHLETNQIPENMIMDDDDSVTSHFEQL